MLQKKKIQKPNMVVASITATTQPIKWPNFHQETLVPMLFPFFLQSIDQNTELASLHAIETLRFGALRDKKNECRMELCTVPSSRSMQRVQPARANACHTQAQL